MDKVILHWSYRDLHELPTEMQSYGPDLMDVYLKENFLTCLPTWLFDFVNLRFMNLTGNLIVTLPDELVLLVNLEVLVLSKNRLQTLPQSIRWLKSLKDLQVNDNQLTMLPQGKSSVHLGDKIDARFLYRNWSGDDTRTAGLQQQLVGQHSTGDKNVLQPARGEL
jgi:Leucine rich repeat